MKTSPSLRESHPVSRNVVQLWSLDPTQSAWLGLAERWLSPDERSRADACLVQTKKLEFMACRAALRGLLGLHTDLHPKEVRLQYGPHGQPLLQPPQTLHFGLAHTAGMALIAVGPRAVGVDVERLPAPDGKDLPSLAQTAFQPHEWAQVVCAGNRQVEVFYRIWTAKEAALKARGLGIGQLDQAPNINGSTHTPWRFSHAGLPWSVLPLSFGATHIGTLVVQGDACAVEHNMLEPNMV